MSEPRWVRLEEVNAIHAQCLAEHGGLPGTRSAGALESALGRPVNAYHYGETNLCALAAGYAFGIARNHPYNDGNKRTAFVTLAAFLKRNGLEFTADAKGIEETMNDLAAGKLSEASFTAWVEARTRSATKCKAQE